jgi:hypothetical protein
MYVAQLTLQLQVPDPSPAMLSVIGTFLSKSGVRATDDSPNMKRLAQSYESLPFKDEPPALLGPTGPATTNKKKSPTED